MTRPDQGDVCITAIVLLLILTCAHIISMQQQSKGDDARVDELCNAIRQLSYTQECLIARLEGREPRRQPE